MFVVPPRGEASSHSHSSLNEHPLLPGLLQWPSRPLLPHGPFPQQSTLRHRATRMSFKHVNQVMSHDALHAPAVSRRDERPIPAPSNDTSLPGCGPPCLHLHPQLQPLPPQSLCSVHVSLHVFLRYDTLVGTQGLGTGKARPGTFFLQLQCRCAAGSSSDSTAWGAAGLHGGGWRRKVRHRTPRAAGLWPGLGGDGGPPPHTAPGSPSSTVTGQQTGRTDPEALASPATVSLGCPRPGRAVQRAPHGTV